MFLISWNVCTIGMLPSDQSQHSGDGANSNHTFHAYMLLKLNILHIKFLDKIFDNYFYLIPDSSVWMKGCFHFLWFKDWFTAIIHSKSEPN